MKKILIVLIIMLTGNCWITYAQRIDNHLEPARGIFDVSDHSFEYYYMMRKLLFNGLDGNPEIRFLEMPSFTAESVLDIEFDRKKSKYYMKYHIAVESIGYPSIKKKVKVIKFETEIEKESVELLKTLFFIATSQVKYMPPPEINADGTREYIVMADGTRYFFSTNEYYKTRAGMTHSPSNGSKMQKLVDVGYKLVELAKSGKAMVSIDTAFKEEIEKLMEELTE